MSSDLFIDILLEKSITPNAIFRFLKGTTLTDYWLPIYSYYEYDNIVEHVSNEIGEIRVFPLELGYLEIVGVNMCFYKDTVALTKEAQSMIPDSLVSDTCLSGSFRFCGAINRYYLNDKSIDRRWYYGTMFESDGDIVAIGNNLEIRLRFNPNYTTMTLSIGFLSNNFCGCLTEEIEEESKSFVPDSSLVNLTAEKNMVQFVEVVSLVANYFNQSVTGFEISVQGGLPAKNGPYLSKYLSRIPKIGSAIAHFNKYWIDYYKRCGLKIPEGYK